MSFSSSSDTSAIPGFSIKKFESQNEVDEKKKKRQEEWEKVRKPEDPEEFPEAPVDNRCLYDKLEEQRVKKQEEIDEQFAFKNQVSRLDEDEVQFLDFVSERQQDITREKKKEEAQVISEMKNAQVIKLTDSKPEEKKTKAAQQASTKRSQSSLLAGAVRRKASDETSPSKKPRMSLTETSDSPNEQEQAIDLSEKGSEKKTDSVESTSSTLATDTSAPSSRTNNVGKVAKVVAILPSVLPGMNQYEDSTDSQSSSSDSEPDFAIGGRSLTAYVSKIQQSH